jgi:hypothetical protein
VKSEHTRLADTLFRHGPNGREPLAPPSGEHVHYQPLRRAGIGVITSRPATAENTCRCWACRIGFNVDHSKPKR